MEIKIVNKSDNSLPDYATEYSAGMDLRASIDQPIIIESLQRILIPTGIFIELPDNFEAQVRPRSGLAIKHGITVLNSPGTIDSDYRGEIKVILINLSNESFTINNGDRIAQLVISKFETIKWSETLSLNDSKRGSGGFGHSGQH